MRKFLLSFLILLFFAHFSFAQISIPEPELNQVFLKILSFIHKINYFDQKLLRGKINITFPTSKSKFRPEDNLRLSFKLELPERITSVEANDPEYAIPYFWHIKLYNLNVTSSPLKEETIPFIPGENYNFNFKIPLSFPPSTSYFFKIELKNAFSNKILKEASSPYFSIISVDEAKIKLNKYKGYLLKMPTKTFNKYEFLFFTPNEVFFAFSEKFNLDSFNNKFVKIEGKESSSEMRNVKVIEILKIMSY